LDPGCPEEEQSPGGLWRSDGFHHLSETVAPAVESKALKARASWSAQSRLQTKMFNDRRAAAGDDPVRLCGVVTPGGQTLDVAVGWNKPTRHAAEQTVVGGRNAKDGT